MCEGRRKQVTIKARISIRPADGKGKCKHTSNIYDVLSLTEEPFNCPVGRRLKVSLPQFTLALSGAYAHIIIQGKGLRSRRRDLTG